jgi:hypothetical protein
MRVRDDHSGSSAASQPAAGPAAAQRPGEAGGTLADAAPEVLRGLGRAPRLGSDAAPGPSGSSRQVRLRTAPPDLLTGLPQAVHETIAGGMGPKDRAMLASSNHALRDSLRGFSTSDKAVVGGRGVQDLGRFRAVLHEVHSLPPERPDLQARPLAVLAGRIGALVDGRSAFDAVLATILQTPAGQRRPMDVPLMMLAAQVSFLEPAGQAGALQRLLQAQEPPGSLAPGLHLLAGRLDDLPQAARQQASEQVLQWAERLEPGPARELLEHLPGLPEAAREPAFHGLLQACRSLAPAQRTERLEALATGSGQLSEPARSQAARGVLAAAESLAPEQRRAVLKPLGQVVHRLPDAEQASTWRAVVRSYLAVPPGQLAAALAQLHDQIRTLRTAAAEQQPAVPVMQAVLQESRALLERGETLPPEALRTMLMMFAQELAGLPPAARLIYFRLVLRSIPRQQQHRSLKVESLATAIEALPVAARQPAWQATLQAVEQLPPLEGAPLFDPVAAQIGKLPVEAQAAAFESLLQAHRRLPAQCQVISVLALGTGCLARPRAQWPQVLDQVLAESAHIPDRKLQGLILVALAGGFCVAEPVAIGPLAPPQPERPGLDVRVRCLDKVVASMPLRPHPPAGFVACVEALKGDVERRLQQRPDDAAVLTAVLERLRRLMGPLDTAL